MGGIPTITPPTPSADCGDAAQAVEPAAVTEPAMVAEPAVADCGDDEVHETEVDETQITQVAGVDQAGPSGTDRSIVNGSNNDDDDEDIQHPTDLGDWSVPYEAVKLTDQSP